MFDRLIAGERLAMIRDVAMTPRALGAAVQVDAGALIGLEIDGWWDTPANLVAGERVTLVRATGSVRLGADGAIKSCSMGLAWVRIDSNKGWTTFDGRVHERVESRLACQVAAVASGAPRRDGRIMNISAGGVRVSLAEHLDTARLHVFIVWAGHEVALPCAVLAVHRFDCHVELRLRFDRLDATQERVVMQVIEAAQTRAH